MCFLKSCKYAAGINGTILKTTTGGENSIISNTFNNNIKIYPNPNDGIFILEFPNPKNNIIQSSITDITGKTVFETTTNQNLYNYTGNKLQSGIYVVTVKEEDRFNVIKMVVK